MITIVDHTRVDIQRTRYAAHNGERVNGEYPGYDQFGRPRKQMWVDGGFTTNPNSPNVPNVPAIFEERYTYDFDSNRTAAYDDRPGGRQPFSHEYTYDGLDRLSEAKRGVWDGSSFTVADDSQRWSLDLLGNWDKVETDLNGDGVYAPSTDDLEDARSHNLVNEITQRTKTRMGSQTLNTTPTWDDAGNLRKEDRNAALEATYTHDGWNRLVKVEYDLSGTVSTRGKYEYNALHWRTVKQADSDGSGESGDSALDQQRVMIYSANWQLLEEYVDDDVPLDTGPSDIDRHFQNFWGVQYIDDLCQRRVDTDFDGDFDDTYFHLTDVQYSTRVVIDRTGQVIERVHYDAFGKAVHQHGTDVDGDRDIDSADESLVQTIYTSGYNTIEDVDADPDAYRAEADLDRDGDVDLTDASLVGSAQSALPFGELSTVDNNIGWDGYVFNAEIRIYHVRRRYYAPSLGRWITRDPLEYFDAMSMYAYATLNPVNFADPSGLCTKQCKAVCNALYPGNGWWQKTKRYSCYVACTGSCIAGKAFDKAASVWKKFRNGVCGSIAPAMNNHWVECGCFLAGSADIADPGITKVPAVLDCACNALFTVQQACNKGKSGFAIYGSLTALDCLSGELSKLIGVYASGGNPIQGAGVAGLSDYLIDIIIASLQNQYTQGTPLPWSQCSACEKLLKKLSPPAGPGGGKGPSPAPGGKPGPLP